MSFGITMWNQNADKKVKLCYMDTDSFLYIKYIYADITKNVETIFDTSNYDLDIPLPKGKNKKVIGLTKGELSR